MDKVDIVYFVATLLFGIPGELAVQSYLAWKASRGVSLAASA